ncbi:DNA-binding XRE family transcriptional regulator [Dyadobacter jejuensis]|uniref:DNA-binding XRE family transcriptional regulator n=1 Tax=Dyadobacter jejuensis TaxID=1082580 RepID=A0A316ATE1_9BACT|nr:XRE family transcriptional regulator [Dyadobacter jejuensis]PWJ60564.1 DNA-binding XRE family transcriptional regulator [Dyadobacter jejuensis]
MQDDILFQISNKLKEMRKGKGVTLQHIANEAGVTKSLVSQIENSRTIPSLPVMLGLIKALDVDLNEFFKDIISYASEERVVIKRKKDYQSFTKENAKGFFYQRIFSKQFKDNHIDVVLLRLEKGAKRPMVRTNAYEFKYILKGTVEYAIGSEKHILEEGDSMFFDANELHNPECINGDEALMLVIYFFNEMNL